MRKFVIVAGMVGTLALPASAQATGTDRRNAAQECRFERGDDRRHPRGVQAQVRHEPQQGQRVRQVRLQGGARRTSRGQSGEGRSARGVPGGAGHDGGVPGRVRGEVREGQEGQERLRQVRLGQGARAQGRGRRRGPREGRRPQERRQAVRRRARHDRRDPHGVQPRSTARASTASNAFGKCVSTLAKAQKGDGHS